MKRNRFRHSPEGAFIPPAKGLGDFADAETADIRRQVVIQGVLGELREPILCKRFLGIHQLRRRHGLGGVHPFVGAARPGTQQKPYKAADPFCTLSSY